MINSTSFDWNAHLEACLKSTEYCCLGTVDLQGTWSNPVYFSWDREKNLYFISQPSSRHLQNLVRDSRLSVAIYSTNQSTFGDVIGIQLEGHAEILAEAQDIERAYQSYYGRRYPETGISEDHSQKEYLDHPAWQFVRITPKQIFYFNTEIFGEARQEVPPHLWKT